MVDVEITPHFQKAVSKIDNAPRIKALKQIEKIKNNPEIGKPMMYARKGTRELYIPPFRLSYAYLPEEDRIIFLDLYHKDEQ
jgi:mRNA-degrading endonuclease RelE of RelBE toxin-antitoxin system